MSKNVKKGKKTALKDLFIEDLGEVRGGRGGEITTLALGEEDPMTTLAIGEEDGDATSFALGEEDQVTTLALGEE